jgi:hypothetical protein
MLAHREKKNGCVVARVRWLTHTGREVSPSGLKSGGAKRFRVRHLPPSQSPCGSQGVRSLPFVGGVQLPAVAGAQGLKYRRFDA